MNGHQPPSRQEQFERLRSERFDVLVIGGGATGAGVALDAVSRGLSVAVVERDDFASGTSSRSTKLIHGGVRYLEQAILHLDRRSWNLVRDALAERAILLRIAPHLVRPLAIVTPLYRRRDVPYMLAGLKLYDVIAGKARIGRSRFVRTSEAVVRFPMLRKQGLRGAVEYHDGQFDDARMNMAIILTALERGAVTLNHAEIVELRKTSGRISGAVIRDRLSGASVEVSARTVINATGPFTDRIRFMEDPNARPMVQVSSGAHIVLDRRFAPRDAGILIPRTEDGRVLFLMPWLGHTLVGTTDRPDILAPHPPAIDEDVEYLLRHVRRYFDLPVDREDVRAAWAGLRPLIAGSSAESTARLPRDHIVAVSDSGLITITGGKWTTYRRMAKDAVDEAVRVGDLQPAGRSRTERIILAGGEKLNAIDPARFAAECSLDEDVAAHLRGSYGDRAREVAAIGRHDRLAAGHPYIEAEVIHAVDREMAQTVMDVLARRLRLAFVDGQAAQRVVSRVIDLMAQRLGWDEHRREDEQREALERLQTAL